MSNTNIGILVGTGAAAGLVYYVAHKRRKDKTIAGKARKQAGMIMDRASKLTDTAADFLDRSRAEAERQKTGIFNALDAGKSAYQKATT